MTDKIFNEDCLEGMKRIPDGSVDMVLTDLPFGITACSWDTPIDLQKFWAEVKRILKPQSSAVMFASGKFTFNLANSNFDWFKYKWVWVKNKLTCFVQAKNCPMHKHEDILIFSPAIIHHKVMFPNKRMTYNPQGLKNINAPKNRAPKFDSGAQLRNYKSGDGKNYLSEHSKDYLQMKTNYPNDVLYFNAVHNVDNFHPTQKPTDLLEYLIKTYTNEGELVLDATIGSGSTAVAAINTNRHFIGFELEEKFYNIANERIAKAYAEKEQRLL